MTEEPLNAKYEHCYKILLIGDSTVGKSSLLLRFVNDKFEEDTASTMHGMDSKEKDVQTADGKVVRLSLWDTAGQERMGFLTSSYYRGAQGILIVYDITNPESYKNIPNWLGEIERYAYGSTVKILVGNKVDLQATRGVDHEKAKSFAADELNIQYIETSAKTGSNVSEAFMKLVEKIKEKKEGMKTDEKSTKINTLLVDQPAKPAKRGFCNV